MRGGCVGAALYAAALSLPGASAYAGDNGDATVLAFSGADVWRNGGFLHGGALWAPGGLDFGGFNLKAVVYSGLYRYSSGALGGIDVAGRHRATILAGWHFVRGKSELRVFGGFDMQRHRLLPDDPGSSLRGSEAGLIAAFDAWTEPLADTMLSADGSLSSVAASYTLRLATGWRLLRRFYFGPEVQALGSDNYQQQRLGLHVTGLQTGHISWLGAAGYAQDSDGREGAYVRFGMSMRR